MSGETIIMTQLAINDGPKLIKGDLRQPWPVFDHREEAALLEVLRSRKWGRSGFDYFNHPDSWLYAFEQAFAKFHDGRFGLVALDRLDQQADHRFANVHYLHAGLREIPGLAPLEIDERVTRWNPYRWPFRFIPGEFDGVHRDQFRKALQAEGVPCGIGAPKPLYTFSMFAAGEWGKTGCPIHCPLYRGETPDYSKVHCPEAERIHETEAVDVPHTVLLGPCENMDLFLDVCRKLRDNTDELKKI